MPQLRALYLPRISHSVHRDLKELALQVLDIVSIRPDLKITYIGLQSKCYQILEKNGPNTSTDLDGTQSMDSNFRSGNDGLAAFDDETMDTSDDDQDIPDNHELLSDFSDESESELEEDSASRVHFKLQEILFYDDKISIFKARHGVI